MIDRTQIVYEALTRDGPLADAIGNRAWSPIAHPSMDGDSAAIVFHQSSGGSHGSGATNTASFEFKCYGGANTYASSRAIFRKLYDRLYMGGISVSSGSIVSASLSNDTQLPPADGENYKAHLATFELVFEGA
jgi:hypothetical protein